MKYKNSLGILSICALILISNVVALAQGNQNLFGDVKIISDSNVVVPKEVLLILRRIGEGEVGRQMVSSKGRYRFTYLKNGDYEIVVESDGKEIGKIYPITIGGLSNSPYGYQYDLEFKWNGGAAGSGASVVSAKDLYNRSAENQAIFTRAEKFVEKKDLDQAIASLKQLVEADKMDFQAWNALGALYLAKEKQADAENAYAQAIVAKPDSERANLSLGRIRFNQKKFEEAVEPLNRAVELQPESGEANMLLGESYLQLKKGSKAIPYLNEAAKFGRPDAHLRLGWLYNAAGLKDRAAAEYEEFLKKQPDYKDRDKLQEYITTNSKKN